MTNKSQTVLALMIFLNPFFAALFITMGSPSMMRVMFMVGIFSGLAACVAAAFFTGSIPARITFALAGALATAGWALFLLFGDSRVPMTGFILVSIGGFLALGSTFWSRIGNTRLD